MSDENTPTNETATNGANGTANGAHHGDPKPADGARKKKKHKRHGKPAPTDPATAATAATPPAEATAAAETTATPQDTADVFPLERLERLQSEDRSQLTEPRAPVTFLDIPPEAPAETPVQATTVVSTEEPQAPSTEVPPNADDVTTTPPHKGESVDDLRLRMKVWTDRKTGKRYLMPTAFMRDIVNGQPVTDAMYAYAMRDDDTKLVTLTAREWNSLPFFYFRQDGPAPRATTRPVDVIR